MDADRGPGPFARLLGFRIAPEGWPFILPLAVATVAVAWLARGFWWLLPLAPALFAAAFFRNPWRVPPADESLIVSPADGRVVQVETTPGGHRIAIFLSVFDVHLNRAPCAGTVEKIEYQKGRFLAAWDARCTAENEQARIAMKTPGGPVKIAQIAGLIARRILTDLKAGDAVARGQRIGLIRFGSRTELWLPPAAEPLCKTGQYVFGAETPLARWPRTS